MPFWRCQPTVSLNFPQIFHKFSMRFIELFSFFVIFRLFIKENDRVTWPYQKIYQNFLWSFTSRDLYSAGSDCISCKPGSFADKPGQSTCILCSAGSFTTQAGEITCTPCGKGELRNSKFRWVFIGKYGSADGATAEDQCQVRSFFHIIFPFLWNSDTNYRIFSLFSK